eukprot:PhM_4_TR4608/c0_g1_i1/m.39120
MWFSLRLLKAASPSTAAKAIKKKAVKAATVTSTTKKKASLPVNAEETNTPHTENIAATSTPRTTAPPTSSASPNAAFVAPVPINASTMSAFPWRVQSHLQKVSTFSSPFWVTADDLAKFGVEATAAPVVLDDAIVRDRSWSVVNVDDLGVDKRSALLSEYGNPLDGHQGSGHHYVMDSLRGWTHHTEENFVEVPATDGSLCPLWVDTRALSNWGWDLEKGAKVVAMCKKARRTYYNAEQTSDAARVARLAGTLRTKKLKTV